VKRPGSRQAAWLLLLCALGCSWLVDPDAGPVLCEAGQVDGIAAHVCPQGLECRAGKCERICRSNVPDLCGDGIDNDCDQFIDEVDSLGRDTCGDDDDNDCDGKVDEDSDNDRDGYFWCGKTAGGGATPEIDCDDSFDTDYPGAPELCDGRDNDCDSRIDEAPVGKSLCEPGSVCSMQRCVVPSCITEGGVGLTCGPDTRCDLLTGACVSKQCADVVCGPNEFCDELSKSCRPVSAVKRDNGEPCVDDDDCVSESCIDAAALRLGSGMRVCGQACCSDEDCRAGQQRCFASGTGARSCMPVGLLPPVAQRECTIPQVCQGNELCGFSRSQDLSAPLFTPRENVITSTCVPRAPLGLGTGEPCASYTQCSSRTCVSNVTFGSLCSNPCGSSNDCQQLAKAVQAADGLGAYCRYVDVTPDDAPVDYAALCVVQRPGETGMGEYGAECTSGRDCLEGGCVDVSMTKKGRCTPTCCNDAHCGPREDGTLIRCVPFAFGARYEMRCDI
jgi:hypothetical protein